MKISMFMPHEFFSPFFIMGNLVHVHSGDWVNL
jgi:hypothetical protein